MIPYNDAPEKPVELVQSVDMKVAIWCLDCDQITAANNCHCRVCGSKSVLTLSKVLNREGK